MSLILGREGPNFGIKKVEKSGIEMENLGFASSDQLINGICIFQLMNLMKMRKKKKMSLILSRERPNFGIKKVENLGFGTENSGFGCSN